MPKQEQEDVPENRYRPIPCGCAPTTESTCGALTESQGLRQGGAGYDFASDYSVGCYAYSTGQFAGLAFWGQGGTPEQEQEDVPKNRYLPMPCSIVVQPQSPHTERLQNLKVSGKEELGTTLPVTTLLRDAMLTVRDDSLVGCTGDRVARTPKYRI